MQNLSPSQKEADIIRVFLSNPVHRWFRNCIFHPRVMYLSRWVMAFFSPLLPLLWEMEKERMEKEVIVWSDSQRVALIRSMVEQTVFTDPDGEGVWYRVFIVSYWVECFCIWVSVTLILMQGSVCLHFCSMYCKVSVPVLVHMLRSSVLLFLTALPPIYRLFYSPSVLQPPCLLTYIRVNNSVQAETVKPLKDLSFGPGSWNTHFSPSCLCDSLYLTLQKRKGLTERICVRMLHAYMRSLVCSHRFVSGVRTNKRRQWDRLLCGGVKAFPLCARWLCVAQLEVQSDKTTDGLTIQNHHWATDQVSYPEVWCYCKNLLALRREKTYTTSHWRSIFIVY